MARETEGKRGNEERSIAVAESRQRRERRALPPQEKRERERGEKKKKKKKKKKEEKKKKHVDLVHDELPLVRSGSTNEPVDESTSIFKPSRSSFQMGFNGVGIPRRPFNISAAIDGKDFEEKISTQRCFAGRQPRPASVFRS